MRDLDTGKQKIQAICDLLKQEAIEPAQQQAREVLENAQIQAKEIVQESEEKARKIKEACDQELIEKKKGFEGAMKIAFRETMAILRQKIEEAFFQESLQKLVNKATKNPEIIARLLTAVIEAIRKEGLDGDISAYISKEISSKEVSQYLALEVVDRLKEGELSAQGFSGGVKIALHDENITLDVSDDALLDIFKGFLRRDFRELVFRDTQLE